MELDDLRNGKSLYTTDGKDVWELLYWYAEPTVTLRNVRTKEEVGGAVYSLNMNPFVSLIPSKPIKEVNKRKLKK